MTLVIAWRTTKLIEGGHRGLQAYRPMCYYFYIFKFFTFFQNTKNVTFYVFCHVSYVFSNNEPNDSRLWQYKVYADIRGGSLERGVIQQWGNRKRVFSGFRTLHVRHLRKWGQFYYIVLFSPLSPFHSPKICDLEWLWMAWMAILRDVFTTTNCHWLIICYLFSYLLSFVYYTSCDQRRSAGSGV